MVDKYLELQWPSRRIPPGGVLHSRKSAYSPEVQNIMNVLMEESKLTLSQRRPVDWCLRTGSCLEDIKKYNVPEQRGKSAPNISAHRKGLSRRRTQAEIIQSGVFDRERYRPNCRIEDREKIKERLQDIMEFGKANYKRQQIKAATPKNVIPDSEEIIHELLVQIKDRAEWLEEMEALGDGAKHREVIHHQIAERIKKINNLNKLKQEAQNHNENSLDKRDSVIKIDAVIPTTIMPRYFDELSLPLSKCSLDEKKNVSRRSSRSSRASNARKVSNEENIADILSLHSRPPSMNCFKKKISY